MKNRILDATITKDNKFKITLNNGQLTFNSLNNVLDYLLQKTNYN